MVNVQRGETNFGSGDSFIDVNITAVDTSKAFIIVYGRGNNTDLERVEFRATFVDTDTIRIQRGETGIAAVATWQVIEATQGEFEIIDSGNISVGSTDTTVNETVNNVGDVDRCTVFLSQYHGNGDNRTTMLYSAELTSTTNLQLVRESSGNTSEVQFWIVKWHTDVNVYNGTTAMTVGTASTAIGATVDLSRTALFFNYRADTNGLAQSAVKGHLTTTTVEFERSTTTGTADMTWSVVEFPADVVVQSDNGSSSPSLDTSTDVSLGTNVTLANTMNVHSNECTGTGTAYPRSHMTSHLSAVDTLQLRVDYTGQTKVATYYVIDFSAWSTGTSTNDERSAKITGIGLSNENREARMYGGYSGGSFSDSFDATTYRDAGNTTASWEGDGEIDYP